MPPPAFATPQHLNYAAQSQHQTGYTLQQIPDSVPFANMTRFGHAPQRCADGLPAFQPHTNGPLTRNYTRMQTYAHCYLQESGYPRVPAC
jgi:hypothetical protein